ncbi:glycosyltransferase family 8 protein, partial [Phascolarctobacterium faecium]|uniref:glycosyltransferase family 8 protein n=1 Tax=Phascolarctobacterium faecium TaxID=33025 RepID=UPI003FEEDA41
MEPFANFHIKHSRFKRVSYFRLYMTKVLKKITRYFLYLDADLMCINSMEAFKKIDLEGKVLAAVSDLPEAVQTRSDFLGLKSGKYFNSGVLWIDTKKWEENSITEKAFSYQGRDPKSFTCHDQDVLNLVMDGDIKFIDEKFNHLGFDGSKVPEGCIIYHFFGRE